MARRFHWAPAWAFATGIGVMLAGPTVARTQQLSIDVLVDDLVPVSDDTLAEARQRVDRIFAALEVQIAWFDATSALRRQKALEGAAAQRTFVTSLYIVRLVAKAGGGRMTPSERAIGFAAVGTRVAIIPYSRVQELARNGASAALVLGHVIAHELGHLLLQRASHSASGLMRATLDLQLAQQGRLLFTPAEAGAIRARIVAER